MNNYYVIKNTTSKNRAKACEEITKLLPLWFGQEGANIQYVKDASKYPAILIQNNDVNIALLVYKEVFDKELKENVIDIHWLGINPQYHRKGLGNKLIKELTTIAKKNNINILTVETLDPEVKNESYLKSYKFYTSQNFCSYYKFSYNDFTHMVKMKKLI